MRLTATLALTLALCSAPAAAQPPPKAPPAAKLEEAKKLFRRGNELRAVGDHEGALSYFERSRALVPSVPNTLNAAICLRELKRYDEALERLELLATEMKSELTAGERAQIGPNIAKLRAKLGVLEVVASVEGARLVVDGRDRGTLPRVAPLRVLPGKRAIRVTKDGYEMFRTRVSVAVGKTARVDARLTPLATVGRLRLANPELAGAEVFVDGARVGTMPWEGRLAPGEHLVWVRRGEVGSAPMHAVVVKGQVALINVEAGALGPELSVSTTPRSATVMLDDVVLGQGVWRGRLPIGRHQVVVREEGYVETRRALDVTPAGPRSLELRLRVDEEHERWGLERGTLLVDVFGGPGLAGTMRSGAEQSCSADFSCADSTALGPVAGASVGYEFGVGLAFELAGGAVRLRKDLSRELTRDLALEAGSPAPTAVRFQLDDTLTLTGGFVGAGVRYRGVLGKHLEVRTGTIIGAAFLSAQDIVNASATGRGERAAAFVERAGTAASAVSLMVMPELSFGTRINGFGISAGLAVPFFVLEGPDNDHGALVVDARCDPAGGTVGCAQAQGDTEEERTFGVFPAFVPTLRAGYAFDL